MNCSSLKKINDEEYKLLKQYSICGIAGMGDGMMTTAEFEGLSEEEKYELLHKEGVHIGKRNYDGQILILLQLHGFYVELYYKKYRQEIDRLVVSADLAVLQPYLGQIHLNEFDSLGEGE